MQKETELWIKYSEENLSAAKVLFESQLYNPCLHNIQQAVEKVLKALIIEKSIPFRKTHNIMELKTILLSNGIIIDLSDDDCDFFDSIYLPSKYPVGSALPYYFPDKDICSKSILSAEELIKEVKAILK